MWYLVLLGIGIVVLVIVIAYSNYGSRSRADGGRVRQADAADEWHRLHHDAGGAMDAEFDDWG